MLVNEFKMFITGYWRCYAKDLVFDFYVRQDGFHIAGIPRNGKDGGRLMPMTLWLSVDSSSEIQVSNGQRSSTWTRDYYRDGNRLVMLNYNDPDSRSVSRPILAEDLSEEMSNMVKVFDQRYAERS